MSRAPSLATATLLLSLAAGGIGEPHADAGRGLQPVRIVDAGGKEVALYKESHALILGVSNYTNGWPKLPGVPKDVEAVRTALESQGFATETVMDPSKSALDQAFTNFIGRHGQGAENRLLFYFAGHGHTVRTSYGEELGYIVPADAPNPNLDLAGFQGRAMEMAQIEIYARRIQSKHALFLFDACFSGSLFALSRAVPDVISYKTANPVRQFITSGSAEERVPDRSIFRDEFVRALDGEGDADRDGYVTGTELGEFLQKTVVNYSRNAQHPQYGKIRNANLDKGDFVFRLASKPVPPPPLPPAGGASALEDVKKQAEAELKAKTSWREWLGKMEGNYADAQALDGQPISTELKMKAWRAFLEGFPADDPFSWRDEELRAEAIKRIAHWTTTPPAPAGGLGGPGVSAEAAAPTLSRLPAGLVRRDGKIVREKDGMEMVSIPEGKFRMGSTEEEIAQAVEQAVKEGRERESQQGLNSDEKPSHQVMVSGFWIDRYEVSNAQYLRFIEASGRAAPTNSVDAKYNVWSGRAIPSGLERHPVVNVSWMDGQAYCAWAGGRLPTEAEWEKAARGTDGRIYPWGGRWEEGRANRGRYHDGKWLGDAADGYEATAPVDAFDGVGGGSPFGVQDMAGNVWEWVGDWYGGDYYTSSPSKDPKGPPMGDWRVLRGGSWVSNAQNLRVANRISYDPGFRFNNIGFRCARDSE